MDFGDTTVVRDLSFDVHAGESFGFLGSNGSGRTTTIRALLGIYEPTAGTSTSTPGFQAGHGERRRRAAVPATFLSGYRPRYRPAGLSRFPGART